VALDQTRARFAQAAARDGVTLGSESFDWLSEQGHVGLERVAKARRDPGLVAPVTAALAVLAEICARLRGDVSVLHGARANLLLAIDLVHRPTGTIVEVDGPEHSPRSGWPHSISTPPTPYSASTRRSTGSCAAPGGRAATCWREDLRPGPSAWAGCSGSGPTTTP
jgi:hypothetical protein